MDGSSLAVVLLAAGVRLRCCPFGGEAGNVVPTNGWSTQPTRGPELAREYRQCQS